MKYVTKQELLKLPAGTVFISDNCLQMLVPPALENDFFAEEILDTCYVEETYNPETGDQSREFNLEEEPWTAGREGCFDDDSVYLVLNQGDIREVIKHLNRALRVQELEVAK